LAIYPSPATDYLNVKIDEFLPGQNYVLITDNLGRVAARTLLNADVQAVSINQLANGIYNLQIIGEGQVTESIRFVKQ